MPLTFSKPGRRFAIVMGMIGWGVLPVFSLAFAAEPGSEASPPRVHPPRVELQGPEAVQQLVVERSSNPGVYDFTTEATFLSKDPAIAEVDATGFVTPRSEGATTLVVTVGGRSVDVAVAVKGLKAPEPIHFANQVIPIFTKQGCNSGGCHGKASGQNGFRLSLLGFEPSLDYETLVKEARGRRVFPAAPDQSLLLAKATAKVPHGGGRRLEPNSHEYRILSRWIAEGMPLGKADDRQVARIEVWPDSRILKHGQKQQVLVTAVYSDGRREDVTRWAQYQSNDTEVASVADGGLVETRDLAGLAAVMARYQGQVAVFSAKVPLEKTTSVASTFRPVNFVDEKVARTWNELGLVPSELCTDSEFLRRASLDLTGTLPTAEQTRDFLADSDAQKRAKLIDRLLDSPEYASFFAIKWADVLRNKREGNAQLQNGTYRFHAWIRESLARNTPYDQLVRDIVAASGTPNTAPAVQWYKRISQPDAFVDDTAQVFLGMRLQCAKCHHHPFEKWSQDDYYGFAAFFARIGRKPALAGKAYNRDQEIIFTARAGNVTHPKSGKVMEPKGLGSQVLNVAATEDPRQKLVDWMADPSNPFFATALVNRYWAHFFGRGIVEPMDDMRLTNPPSNPELIQALADHFVKSGYDLKDLIRTICLSRTYGLSSIPNATNAKDKQSFSRRYPKRMGAEVLHDAIVAVTGVPTSFGGLPPGTRAIDLPDESIASDFLDTFGRPKRDSPCECERVGDASLSQSLMLLNSNEIHGKLISGQGKAESLAKDPRPDNVKLEELFWSAFSRAPSSSEIATALDHLQRKANQRKEAFEDIIWALINAKEFQFND